MRRIMLALLTKSFDRDSAGGRGMASPLRKTEIFVDWVAPGHASPANARPVLLPRVILER
jgi:hypothetical protein